MSIHGCIKRTGQGFQRWVHDPALDTINLSIGGSTMKKCKNNRFIIYKQQNGWK